MDRTLYIAAVSGDIGVLMQNKDKLADETTPKNNTVLHLVSHFDKTECVPEIISMVPSLIRRVNSNNESALHVAARKGHYGVVRELIRCAVSLESGVESGVGSVKEMLRMRNKHGDTALYDAVRYKHGNVVEVLIREDPEFSHPANNAGETPLYIAAERGYDDLVDVILNTCTSPAYGGPNGRTALHAAIFSNSEESTRRLLAWKQSLIRETDERGWSPLHYAAFFNREEIVSYLLSVDGSIAYLVDNDMNTGLHIAARQGWIDIARKLILCRPDCGEIVNGKGQNMLHIALEHEKDEFADIYPELQAAGATRGLRNSINIGEGKGRINQNEDDEKRRKNDAEKGRKEDEQIRSWRKISDTTMIVATLIATVTFTAGFTMPGGYIQSGSTNQGMAVLSRKTAFQVFIIADVIALLLSSSSIFLNFLASEIEDLYKLRKTVRLAIVVAVAAIGAMMVAFSTGTYVVF